MDNFKKRLIFFSIFFAVIVLLAPIFVLASNTNGTIDSVSKYAWGENIGWLNFGSGSGAVTITDSFLGGYVWGENIGWLSLNCANGVSTCATVDYKVENDGNGNLSGYAWGENVGWINFNPTYGGVTINSSGEFFGYAWGENIGWILFNCADKDTCATVDFKVKTDWRPKNSRPYCNNATDDDGDGKTDYPADPGCSSLDDDSETDPVAGGGGGGYSVSPPQTPVAGFGILINNGASQTNNILVNLNLSAGADTARLALSNTADFKDASQETLVSLKEWDLCRGLTNHSWCSLSALEKEKIINGAGNENYRFTVYAKFFTQYGYASSPVSAEIIFAPAPEKVAPPATAPTEAQPSAPPVGEKKKNILEKIGDFVAPIIPDFLKPEEEKKPAELPLEEIVPREAPLSLRGRWQLLSSDKIKNLVLAPLPQELKNLVLKMPGLSQTFKEVGVNKMADLEKLRGAKLFLPNFMESAGLNGNLTLATKTEQLKNLPAVEIDAVLNGEKSLPVASLSLALKEKLPTEVLFIKNKNSLIDYQTTLSLNEQGEPEQTTRVIVGKTLNLAVKAEPGTKAVRGFVVFKSRETALEYQNQTADKTKIENLKTLVLNRSVENSTVQDKQFGILARAVAVSVSGLNQNTLAVAGNGAGAVLGVMAGQNIEERLVLQEFSYQDPDGDGIYTAEIQAPSVAGEYEIITIMDYEKDGKILSKEILMRTVVDPEGYVFEKIGDKELRLPNVAVALYRQKTGGEEFELWPAKEYSQENPQTTDVTGKYSFLAPPGKYYLTAKAQGYGAYQSAVFEVQEGPGVHFNIELKNKNWLKSLLDWKTAAILALFFLVVFNFYKDRKRKK